MRPPLLAWRPSTLRAAIALSTVLAMASPGAAHAQAGRWTFVNSQQLLLVIPCYVRLPPPPGHPADTVWQRQNYYAWADSIWQREVDQYRIDLARIQGHLDSAGAIFRDASPLLTAEARAARRKALTHLQDSLTKASQTLKQQTQDDQRAIFRPIEDRINLVLDSLVAARQLAGVMDLDRMGASILSANRSLDLTQRAVAALTPSPTAPKMICGMP